MVRGTAIIGNAIVNQLRVTGSAHCGRVINQMRTTAAYCRPLAGVPARGTENEGKGYGDPGEERRGETLLPVSTKPGIAAASRDCEKLNCTRVIQRYVLPLRYAFQLEHDDSAKHRLFVRFANSNGNDRPERRINPILFFFFFFFLDNDRFFPIAGYLDRDRGGGEKSPISLDGEEGEDPVPLARDKGRLSVNLRVFFVRVREDLPCVRACEKETHRAI